MGRSVHSEVAEKQKTREEDRVLIFPSWICFFHPLGYI